MNKNFFEGMRLHKIFDSTLAPTLSLMWDEAELFEPTGGMGKEEKKQVLAKRISRLKDVRESADRHNREEEKMSNLQKRFYELKGKKESASSNPLLDSGTVDRALEKARQDVLKQFETVRSTNDTLESRLKEEHEEPIF